MPTAARISVIICVLAAPLAAQTRPGPGGGLTCSVADGTVAIEWNFAFLLPIDGYILERDGAEIAKLPPEAVNYKDTEAEPGAHGYRLLAINWNGEVLDLVRCDVLVPDTGLRCRVANGNQVHLSWGPILIDVLILKFRIARDGETIAVVPPDQLSHVDEVFAIGSYRYAVFAVTSPDSEFLLGRCAVEISCFGIRHQVTGFDVHLGWDASPVARPGAVTYLITRDGALVVKTQETRYTDTVPGPGTYRYQVYEEFGTPSPPVRIIGDCLIQAPGPIPAPQDLSCTVLDVGPIEPVPLDAAEPGVIDSDGDGVIDSVIPLLGVSLRWQNPIAYDRIVIARNGAIIATLAGDTESYRDRVRGGGTFHYAVYGTLGDLRSRAAECRVEVPPPFIPPPQDFTCRVIDLIPIDPVPADEEQNLIPIPVPSVVLSWWNPIAYSKLVILRDGVEIARLPGEALSYRDTQPPAGKHVYGIHGVVESGRQSPTVRCEVEVGPRPVPPVEDLLCQVEQPTSTNPQASVILSWKNPIAYDKIIILRDNQVIFEDTGELEKYRDLPVPPGVHVYAVVAVLDGRRSPPASCQVVIEGPPRRNLLYFTRGRLDPEPVDLSLPPPVPEPLPPLPGNRLTCLADNTEPLQGWSFGVRSDPRSILPVDAGIRGTATAAFNAGQGPDFLSIEILAGGTGVVMGVVIDAGATSTDPGETLPPGRGHRLLNLQYAAGPDGVPNQAYPVRYTSDLGVPPVQTLFVVNGFEVEPSTLPGWVSIPGPRFLRADSNGDGKVNISDPSFTLNWLFLGGRKPGCLEAANANGSAQVNIADPIYTLNDLFGDGPPPPPPFPTCGVAPAPLGCERPGECLGIDPIDPAG
jgi:hypothetical protein